VTFRISETTTLKLLSLSDAPALLKVINTSRQRLHRYLHWVDRVTDLPSTQDYIKQRITSNYYNAQWFTICVNNELHGVFGIKYVNTDTNVAELAYWLSDNVVGQGIITSIIVVVRSYLRSEYDTKTLEFRVLEQNLASIHVAKKFGGQLMQRKAFKSTSALSQQQLLIFRASI
jgi:ribosomal-protein-serine acetyltransferase